MDKDRGTCGEKYGKKKRRGNQYGGIYFSLQADKKEERYGERVCDKKRCTGKRRKAEFCGQAGVFIFDKVGIGRQLCLETGRASNQKRGPKPSFLWFRPQKGAGI